MISTDPKAYTSLGRASDMIALPETSIAALAINSKAVLASRFPPM
jgi:hypothetical protein